MSDKPYVVIGYFSPKLTEQLRGSVIPRRELQRLDRDVDAMNRLSIRGYLSEQALARARKNVVRRINGFATKKEKNG